MSIIVDTSIWVDYFRDGNHAQALEFLIDENLIVTNDLILAELVPFLKIRKQEKLISLLRKIRKFAVTPDWEQLIRFHYQCLRQGVNGIGIPDLIIAQNALNNDCRIFSLDRHFVLLGNVLGIELAHPSLS